MKKLFTLLFLFAALFQYARAQDAIAVSEPNSPVSKAEKWKAIERQYFGCAKCDFLSKVEGICSNDQIPLIRIGNYYCPLLHNYVAYNADICAEHKIPLVEMKLKYKLMYMQPQAMPVNEQSK